MDEAPSPMTAHLREVHDLPLPDLIFRAQEVHRRHHDPRKVQLCSLLSIKTGGCPEDCGYCPQSLHHRSDVAEEPMVGLDRVLEAARRARTAGATRLCMGAAWRESPGGRDFEAVLEMVRAVREAGLEACCTLGMLTDEEARRLREAGLTSYNHNLDTGPSFYGSVVTTRSYEERIETLRRVRRAGISVCSGGIIGMGESIEDRMALLAALASLDPPPESVPINALVRVPGTPFGDRPPVGAIEMARMIATARIGMPRSLVRLSAGRLEMSPEAQALCFVAGANSIFIGERLLTTPNPVEDRDRALLDALGLEPLPMGIHGRSPS
jgi:biotin synthase